MIRSLVRWAEALVPALSAPRVRGAVSRPVEGATVWTSSSSGARVVVIYLTSAPDRSRWIAASIAVRLDAMVIVTDVASDSDAAQSTATTLITHELAHESLAAGAPIAVVGEADAAPVAIAVSRSIGRRLALISPTAFGAVTVSGVPTTLIQAPSLGPERARIVELEVALRRAGVAVRETEYADVEEGWARHPRFSAGSKRALDDLVAFLDRGIGQASTFDVIPGWDLH